MKALEIQSRAPASGRTGPLLPSATAILTNSLLLSLPLELRREVWQLVLFAPCRLRPMQGSMQGLLPIIVKATDSIALLGACRQTYDEALDIF